ncbi:MAG: transglutaminase domain-containing protein [Clostridia bacterium]|nr:transglutaminase domain-containing protein [Clostridia bacterium]
MKRFIAILLCLILALSICSCSDNKDDGSDTSSETISTDPLTEAEIKFNELELKPDNFLSLTSENDLTDIFSTSFLEKTYDFELNKANAEKLLKETLNTITKDKNTNLDKATACYDRIIKNVEYHDYGFSNWVSLIVTLNDKQGNPFDFAYTYYAMLRYIGIDAKLEKGFRSLEVGGNSMHSWVTVEMDGVKYYFDPFTDNNNADLKETETCYDCFLKTDEEVGYRYIED